MSLFSGISHAWHSFSHTVHKWADDGKRYAEDATQAVEHVAEEGYNSAKSELGKGVDALKSGFDKALDAAEEIGEDIAKDATKLADTVVKDAAKAMKDAWNAIKDLAEDLEKAFLRKLAKEVYGDWESVILPMITNAEQTFANVEADLDKFKDGIKNGNTTAVIEAVGKIFYDVSPLKAAVQHAINGGMESATFAVAETTSLGISEQGVLGVAININALEYLFEHGSFDGFPGNLISFFEAIGFAVGADEGITGDILLGFVSADPSKIGGPSINVNLALDVEVGGSVSIGLTATPLPPSFSSITVGLSGGEEVRADIGVGYTKVLGMINPEGTFQNPQNLPSGANAKGSGNPNLYWSKYNWDDMNAVDQGYWSKLGWNSSLWNGDHSPGTVICTWDNEGNGRPYLSNEYQTAAGNLGYEKKTWNAPVSVEAWAADNPNIYWGKYDWEDMLRHESLLWATLGWNQNLWDNNLDSSTSTKDWNQLTLEEKKAAAILGFNETRWALPS